MNSLQLSGSGKTVTLSFAVPSEVLDMIPIKKASRAAPHAARAAAESCTSGPRADGQPTPRPPAQDVRHSTRADPKRERPFRRAIPTDTPDRTSLRQPHSGLAPIVLRSPCYASHPRGRSGLLLRHADGGIRSPPARRHRRQAALYRPRLDPGVAVRSRPLSGGRSGAGGARLGRGLRDDRAADGAGGARRHRRLPPRRSRPAASTARQQADVALPDGSQRAAWVYFYNAPLGRAPRIASGDYLEHVKVR